MTWFYRIFLGTLTLFCPVVLAACYGAPYGYGDVTPNPPRTDAIQDNAPDDLLRAEEMAAESGQAGDSESVPEVESTDLPLEQ